MRGWKARYRNILDQFGYSKDADYAAALFLNLLLKRQSETKLKKLIKKKPVFVIGAGPSLETAIPHLKKYHHTIKICADSALDFLLENKIRPQVVVTDLDGNLSTMAKLAKTNTVFVVHAHGDNLSKLEFVKNLKNCVGTTQTQNVGKIKNFGGFTDGDRAVFLAEHFGASKIFLVGMDFGLKIGHHSATKKQDRKIKLKKLKFAKMLLEWLSPKATSQLFTLSAPIAGFKKIKWDSLASSALLE